LVHGRDDDEEMRVRSSDLVHDLIFLDPEAMTHISVLVRGMEEVETRKKSILSWFSSSQINDYAWHGLRRLICPDDIANAATLRRFHRLSKLSRPPCLMVSPQPECPGLMNNGII